METAFADTVYWQALYDVKDDLHTAAIKLAGELRAKCVRIITSEMVLTEVLNALGNSQLGRRIAVDLVQHLKADPNVAIAPNSECPFPVAFELYKKSA